MEVNSVQNNELGIMRHSNTITIRLLEINGRLTVAQQRILLRLYFTALFYELFYGIILWDFFNSYSTLKILTA